MSGRQRILHADGREWTFGELWEIPVEFDGRRETVVGVGVVAGVSPVLLCTDNRYAFAGDVTDDMVVVQEGGGR